jgi:hypothetical protein
MNWSELKTAQGMLDLLQGRRMVSRSDLPLLFLSRESVRHMDEPFQPVHVEGL